MRNWDSLEYEQKNLSGKWEASYAPKGFWRGVAAMARAEEPKWLKPVKSPREEALAQIKAAEKRQADGLVRPFTAAQYKRWSMDPRPRPATYYDGSPNPVGYATRAAYEYALGLWQAQRTAECEARVAGAARVAARHEEYRAKLARGPRQPAKVKGKRKGATA